MRGKVSGSKQFKSVSDWESALMTLPDSNFFELLRSVFGNIKTPFNKQRLLEDLSIFLSRGEIQRTIAAYIDEKDSKIIAAVALLKDPVPEDMEQFFSGEFSREELYDALINLEERLILYRFRDEGILRLALNPVLEPVLAPLTADSEILFPSYLSDDSFDKNVPPQLSCICDGRIMAALFAFIFSEEELFKVEAKTGLLSFRKKILDKGKKILAGLDLELSVKTLLLLGLFRVDDRSLVPCGGKIADFSDLTSVERQEYWTAGVYICLNAPAGDCNGFPEEGGEYQGGIPSGLLGVISSGGGSLGLLRRIAFFIHHFNGLLDPKRFYPENTLRKFWELVKKDGEKTLAFYDSNDKLELSFNALLTAMERTGLLEKKSAGSLQGIRKTGPVQTPHGETGKPVIAMDTAFSLVLYPEISFADALMLGLFCTVKENAGTETAVSFELTRQSVMRGFDQGINTDAMTKLLERLSGNRLEASLGWTLKEWENRYSGVTLHEGIILSLAEDRRYLAEAEPVASLVRKELAPGVYLLRPEDRSVTVRTLKRAGVDIIAQPPMESNLEINGSPLKRGGLNRNSFSSLDFYGGESLPGLVTRRWSNPGLNRETAELQPAPLFSGKRHSGGGEADAIREKFSLILEKMSLTKQERDELTARIERRLVLSETQLEKTSLRYEKLEARGLDYSGKSIIAKQSIDSGSMVEVTWPCSGGGVNRVIGVAQALEKSGAEKILVLKTFDPGDDISIPGNTIRIPGNTIRIPLGKISLLRRIKKSIFGE